MVTDTRRTAPTTPAPRPLRPGDVVTVRAVVGKFWQYPNSDREPWATLRLPSGGSVIVPARDLTVGE